MQNFNIKSIFHINIISVLPVLLFLCTAFQANAQKTITGTVYDVKGVPIGGVNVIVKGNKYRYCNRF